MIQVNELRIGNYVSDRTIGVCKVSGVNKNLMVKVNPLGEDLEFTLVCKNIDPVPLTAEILKKYHTILETVREQGNELKYLHQLQNLFLDLTGQELIIQL